MAEFSSIFNFLPDSVKEWYSPEDHDFLRETIRQRKIRERQQHKELQFDIPDISYIQSPAYAAATAAEATPPPIDFAHYSFDFAQQVHLPSDPKVIRPVIV